MKTFVTAAVALAVLAGCSPGTPTAAPPSTSSTASEVEILALGKEVAQCIRDNGLPGFPDPFFEDGKLELPPVDSNVEQQGQAILEGPCRDQWQRLEQLLPEEGSGDEEQKEGERQPMGEEDLAKLREYAKCVREHGFPTWPDPDPTGFFNLVDANVPEGIGKGDRPEDATFRDALDACEQFSVPGMGMGIHR
jgi:hypothetical protein